MKRKYNNTDNGTMRVSISERLKISLFHCAVQLGLSVILIGIILFVFCLMKKAGVYQEIINVYTINVTIIYALLIFSIISSVIAVQISINVIMKFVKAYESIKNGNYDVRLSFRKSKILRKTAGQFNNMAQQLQKTEMLSSDFISSFSHEMKTPIASIKNFAELIKKGEIPSETRNECLDVIIQESENLNHLSQRILLLSRLDEQAEISDKNTVNISEQLRLALAATYHKWSEKNITVDAEATDYFTTGDAMLLDHVWHNLIDNAVKFSPDGGEITIRISPQSGMLSICISNQGTPIPKENQSDIFKKFYRCSKDSGTAGNGLGLPMVKQIVNLHNGSVCVKKSDAKQTVFEVRLPEKNN